MKKIGKLQINAEKILMTKELVTIRGGYNEGCCKCTDGYAMVAISKDDCESSCHAYGQHGVWSC